MKENIYIGIDGGGTKTKLIMEDDAGQRLAELTGGPANICTSVDGALQSIQELVDKALYKAGIKARQSALSLHLGLGLAGTEIPQACNQFYARLPWYDTIMLESDAYAACLGAHGGKDGAIVISGTGTVAYRILKGQTKKLSGWGFPHSNEGSGAWIGLELTRLTFQQLDGFIGASPLLEAVMAIFNQHLGDFVTWANAAGPTEFATLAPLFAEYLALEDPWAVDIAHRGAGFIDQLITKLLEGTKDLPLSLFGGMMPSLEPYLSSESKAQLVQRSVDAAEGALMMVKNRCVM